MRREICRGNSDACATATRSKANAHSLFKQRGETAGLRWICRVALCRRNLGSTFEDGISGALYIFVSNGNVGTQKEASLTPETGRRLDEVKRQLVENEAQRKE